MNTKSVKHYNNYYVDIVYYLLLNDNDNIIEYNYKNYKFKKKTAKPHVSYNIHGYN